MSEDWKPEVRIVAEGIIVLAVSLIIFELIIQPVLISISPIFAPEYASSAETIRQYLYTPANIIWYTTTFIVFIIYVTIKVSAVIDSRSPLNILYISSLLIINIVLPRRIVEWFLNR